MSASVEIRHRARAIENGRGASYHDSFSHKVTRVVHNPYSCVIYVVTRVEHFLEVWLNVLAKDIGLWSEPRVSSDACKGCGDDDGVDAEMDSFTEL